MTRWEAFTTICSYLRAGLLGGKRAPERDIVWELMIEVASFHLVTPALGSCLGTAANVPPDVRNYFEAAAALNDRRNEGILSGLARIAGLLNAIDIEPLLLKGVAHLVEGTYPEPSMRILGDVDILIPANRSADAVTALQAAGYGAIPSDVIPPPAHHHLPMLHDPENGLGVELHTDVIGRSPDAVISTAWFCEMAQPVVFRNQRVRLPEPTRNAGHTIFHSEIFHGLYAMNKIQLRHLLDLALIRARHEGAIDWTELDHRFSAAGFGEVLSTYLCFADELLGQPAPKLSHSPRKDAMAELRSTESRNSFHLQIELLKKSRDQLQTALSLMIAERDRFQCEAERLSASCTVLEADRHALQAELSHMTAWRDRLQAEAERLSASYTVLEADRHALQAAVAAHAQTQIELDNVTRAREELEREMTRIRKSRSWRLTGPLRVIAGASRRWLQ